MIIATLVAAGRLTKEHLYSAADRLEDARLKAHEWSWIDEESAADIEIREDVSRIAQVRALLEGSIPNTDVIVQSAATREKKLLVADMDSTMIGQECIDELADYAGKKDEIARVTERAMQGELDFATALVERVASLNGLNIGAIDRCRSERVRPNAGAKTLVQTMKSRGAATLLVTGGFHDFADPMAAELGFTEVRANYLESVHGRLTGKVAGEVVDAKAKCAALIEMRERLALPATAVLAVGDGANDAPMIQEAGLGVAYRAKPKLVAVAGARLEHNDLTALLWAQGIPQREWVTG